MDLKTRFVGLEQGEPRAGETKEQHEIIASFCYGLIQNSNIKELLPQTHEILKHLGLCWICAAIRAENFSLLINLEWLGEPGNIGKQQEITLPFTGRNQWAQRHPFYFFFCNVLPVPDTPKLPSLKGTGNTGAGKTSEPAFYWNLDLTTHERGEKINSTRRNFIYKFFFFF